MKPDRPVWVVLGVLTCMIGLVPLVVEPLVDVPGGEYIWLPLTISAGFSAIVFGYRHSLYVLRWWFNCVAVLCVVRMYVFASEGRVSAPWIWASILTLAWIVYTTDRDAVSK